MISFRRGAHSERHAPARHRRRGGSARRADAAGRAGWTAFTCSSVCAPLLTALRLPLARVDELDDRPVEGRLHPEPLRLRPRSHRSWRRSRSGSRATRSCHIEGRFFAERLLGADDRPVWILLVLERRASRPHHADDLEAELAHEVPACRDRRAARVQLMPVSAETGLTTALWTSFCQTTLSTLGDHLGVACPARAEHLADRAHLVGDPPVHRRHLDRLDPGAIPHAVRARCAGCCGR